MTRSTGARRARPAKAAAGKTSKKAGSKAKEAAKKAKPAKKAAAKPVIKAIPTAEFFGATPVGGSLKQWNGSAWVAKPLNAWPASTFVRGVLKRWTGAEWRLAAT